MQLNPAIFKVSEKTSTSTELFIEASDFSLAGIYSVRLIVFYENYTTVNDQIDFDVEIVNPCAVNLPS